MILSNLRYGISYGQVYAGAKPFVEKVINHLTEGLLEALLNVFTENKTKVLKSLDVQGYCQLMLEVHVDFLLVSKVRNRNMRNGNGIEKWNYWMLTLTEKASSGVCPRGHMLTMVANFTVNPTSEFSNDYDVRLYCRLNTLKLYLQGI